MFFPIVTEIGKNWPFRINGLVPNAKTLLSACFNETPPRNKSLLLLQNTQEQENLSSQSVASVTVLKMRELRKA